MRCEQIVPRIGSADYGGDATEILRSDDPHFQRFGQVYVTTGREGVIKAWHKHRKQTAHFYVISGTMKVALYDDREDSPTRGQYQVEILGERGKDALLIIPNDVWHGMMSLQGLSALINVPTETYDYDDPDEIRAERDAFDDVWTVQNR